MWVCIYVYIADGYLYVGGKFHQLFDVMELSWHLALQSAEAPSSFHRHVYLGMSLTWSRRLYQQVCHSPMLFVTSVSTLRILPSDHQEVM